MSIVLQRDRSLFVERNKVAVEVFVSRYQDVQFVLQEDSEGELQFLGAVEVFPESIFVSLDVRWEGDHCRLRVLTCLAFLSSEFTPSSSRALNSGEASTLALQRNLIP